MIGVAVDVFVSQVNPVSLACRPWLKLISISKAAKTVNTFLERMVFFLAHMSRIFERGGMPAASLQADGKLSDLGGGCPRS